MASLNNCCFIGNVGKIETRYMNNGDQVTNLSLACNESWKGKDGEKQERCEWINVVMYRKLAEIADKYVSKGNQIYISGKMSTRKWQDKNGQDRYTTEIIATDMVMLGSKQSEPEPRTERSNQAQQSAGGFDEDDDLIPF